MNEVASQRGTGRTQRMLVEALEHAERGKEVAVVGDVRLLRPMLETLLLSIPCSVTPDRTRFTPRGCGTIRLVSPERAADVASGIIGLVTLTDHKVDDDELAAMRARKDAAYDERTHVVALLAKMAIALGWRAGVGAHEGEDFGKWKHVVRIDLPTGQVSWHYTDAHLPLFAELPPYSDPWDGHDTAEKYRRVDTCAPGGKEGGT